MTETILVVNAGSSSIKFQLFSVAANERLERLFKGQIEAIGTSPRLLAKNVEGEVLADETWPAEGERRAGGAREARRVPASANRRKAAVAVGHRVVHGGPDYSEPTVITRRARSPGGSPRWRPRPRAVSSSLISAAAHPCARSRTGRSVESTMGFTALDGLPMGTRPGQLDAARCSTS